MMDLGVITPDLAVNLKEIEPASLAREPPAVGSLDLGDLLVTQPALPRTVAAQGDPQFTFQGTWLIVPDGLVNPDEFSPEPFQVFDTLSDLDARCRGGPVHRGKGTVMQLLQGQNLVIVRVQDAIEADIDTKCGVPSVSSFRIPVRSLIASQRSPTLLP